MRTPTVMVLEGKKTLAFEGCNDDSGCCPMNCTHVYNYEQAMAYLYPAVEQHAERFPGERARSRWVNGGAAREGRASSLPGRGRQMGCVMKVYREWQRARR
jgi:hypothetical protein